MKKLLSLIMAIAMMATMTVTVFADDDPPAAEPADPNAMEASGTVQIPDIDVSICGVPATGATLFINPYGFELKLATADIKTIAEIEDETINTTTDKVFSPTYYLENNTTLALDVYVNGHATVKTGSTMTLAKDALDPASTKKEALVYVTFGDTTVDRTASPVVAAALTPPATFSAASPGNNFLLGLADAKVSQKVGSLAASTDADNKAVYGFQFAGNAVSDPKEAWADTDGIDVSLVFSYKPAAPAAAAPAAGG